MTSRTYRYFERQKYIHWWEMRLINGYDAITWNGKIEVGGNEYYYVKIKLYPNLYTNPNTNSDGFKCDCLHLPHVKAA